MIEGKVFPVRTQLTVKLTTEDIDDIMASALEGGISYWCCEAKVVEDLRCADWGHEQIARGGALILHDAIEDKKQRLDLVRFLKGFQLWVENGDDRWGAVTGDGKVDTGNIDGERADMIIQYAVFGEVIYG